MNNRLTIVRGKREKINKIGIIIIITSFVVIGTAFKTNCQNAPEMSGILQGKVSIGPLCPHEPCNLSQDQIAKAYRKRKIIIYDQCTKIKVATNELNQNREFSVSLKPGKYIIDVTDRNGNELPLERPRDIHGNVQSPAEITIKAGEKVEVNFDIDTGMR